MSLSGKFFDSESLDDSTESLTLSGTQNIDGLKALEDLIDSDFLLKERISKLNFILDGSSVDLDLIDIGFLSLEVKSLRLSVTDESDNRAVLEDLVSELLRLLSIGLKTLVVFSESSSLGLEPILVKSSLE
jgi:hypothetical protein